MSDPNKKKEDRNQNETKNVEEFLFYPQWKLQKKQNPVSSINFSSMIADRNHVSPMPTYSSKYLPRNYCLYSSDSDSDSDSDSNKYRFEEDTQINNCWYNIWSDDESDDW